MPGVTTRPTPEHFVPVKETSEPLDYADLVKIDLSTYEDGPQVRQKLAEQLRDAMRTQGFFYVINHGLSIEDIQRQVDIGYTVITKTSQEEKTRLEGQMKKTGSYQGFKPRKYWTIDQGVKDQIEQYNFNRDLTLREHPEAFKPYLNEIDQTVHHLHEVVLYRLLTLFAISLDLPENFFVDRHRFEVRDDSWFRYMMFFHDHNEEDMKRTDGVWLKGHCDFGSITMLFSQPMSSLQLMDHHTKKWKYVKHVPGSMVINAGEMFEWWTGGFFKATIHRVYRPPVDQRNQDRCAFYYFVVPNDHVKINTILEESSVLREAGVERRFEPGSEPTSELYRSARISAYGVTDIFKGKGAGVQEEEIVGGIKMKHYN